MMKKVLLATAALLAPMSAMAANFSFTGTFRTVNDVQFFNFNVGSTSTVTLRSWGYAGGVNAAGTTIARGGFDTILALFDSSGALINQNDDGGCGLVAADAVTGRCWDTYLSSTLSAGTYTVAVMDYANFANGPNLSNGFTGGAIAGFVDASGNQRTNAWAFDVLNVNAATTNGAVPEPATWAMMIGGFGAVGASMRYRRRKTAVTFA